MRFSLTVNPKARNGAPCASSFVPELSVTRPPDDAGTASTTRQKFEQHLNTPVCGACHKTIDGIGFGFENYDAVGAYRTEENGIPVDASGEIDRVRRW